jgi:hypothetical protein
MSISNLNRINFMYQDVAKLGCRLLSRKGLTEETKQAKVLPLQEDAVIMAAVAS